MIFRYESFIRFFSHDLKAATFAEFPCHFLFSEAAESDVWSLNVQSLEIATSPHPPTSPKKKPCPTDPKFESFIFHSMPSINIPQLQSYSHFLLEIHNGSRFCFEHVNVGDFFLGGQLTFFRGFLLCGCVFLRPKRWKHHPTPPEPRPKSQNQLTVFGWSPVVSNTQGRLGMKSKPVVWGL